MKKRSPLAVLFLPIITIGIYGLVWYVSTKEEMKTLGAKIPTAWLLIIPFANFYWLWVYSEGVETVTKKKTGHLESFLLLFFLGVIGMAIIQNKFNQQTNQ